MTKRIQNKIAESRWALPTTTAYTLLIYILSGMLWQGHWIQLALTGIATLLMVELNNSNSLIRIYSRMVSCSFLALTMLDPYKLESAEGCLVTLCMVAFYLFVCHAYQDKNSTGWVFFAFASIGIASTVWVQILFFVPILWVVLAANILAMSFKTFVASVVGTAIPYWFLLPYHIYQGDITPLGIHFAELSTFDTPLAFDLNATGDLIPLCFVILLTAIGGIHFVRTSYKDKIRTRMIYEMFIALALFTILFMALQPQHTEMAMRILIVSAAPLIGHYIALTSSKITNMTTIVIFITTLVITACKIWM